jgi:hypothetical protein
MNVATFWGDDAEAFDDIRFWPVAGFSLALHLPQFLGIETDLLYASRGGAYAKDTTVTAGRISNKVNTIKAHTLTIPLLLKITAPIGTEVQPFFFGGPAWAYLLSKDFATELVGPDSNGNIQTVPLTPAIPRGDMVNFDVFITVGGGLEWGLGTFQMRLNLAQQSLDGKKKVDVRTLTLDVMAGFVF